MAFSAATLLVMGCQPDDDADSVPQTEVTMGAAFMDLDYVDVYNMDGEPVAVFDSSVDFHDLLPIGHYLMDFVADNGEHSFLPDGRMAFAPMMQGGLPVEGPVTMAGLDNPVWGVEIHPDLEANAHLTIRQRAMDPTLLPWKQYFTTWGDAENPDWQPPDDSLDLQQARLDSWSYSATGTYATARMRVTWEASFAMTGKYTTNPSDTTTCNSVAACWKPRADSYAVWDYDSNGTGYVDYDTAAFTTANSAFPGGNSSCANVGGSDCGVTVGTAVGTAPARDFTCQSSAGTCTSGSTGTKPRGGECKFFQNLVLYRSGQYNAGSWKTLPSDSIISGAPTTYPAESSATMNVGDALRDTTNIHSLIIVGIDVSGAQATVVDANWVGTQINPTTKYYEYIGSHNMPFTGSGNANLGNYRKLDCIYGSSPC